MGSIYTMFTFSSGVPTLSVILSKDTDSITPVTYPKVSNNMHKDDDWPTSLLFACKILFSFMAVTLFDFKFW